jgi:tRNA threonylcarbamoyladenosine biosynthesis protein TsaE
VPASVTRSQEETEHLAEALAVRLRAGDVLLLSGSLGAGKTAFVRGLARGLGVDPDEVSSPTFTLLHEYGGGRLRLFHADLYRLGQGGAADLGLEDQRVQEGVLAVEWPDRLARPVAGAIVVVFAVVDDTTRDIRIGDGGSV